MTGIHITSEDVNLLSNLNGCMTTRESGGADSPASKAFAARLAKYAYRPTDAPSAGARSQRSSPRRLAGAAISQHSGHDIKLEDQSTEAGTIRGDLGVSVSIQTPTKRTRDTQVEAVMLSPSPSKRSRPASSAAAISSNAEAGPSTPPSKRKPSPKKPRPYAGPEVYAHLKPVTDHLKSGLDIIFCGINPGKMSSAKGHHFAHPTNKFWRALHSSGLTSRLLDPSEDHLMPDEYSYGLTNLCGRPTAEQSELSTLEMRLNVLPFTLKLTEMRARIVCFVGKKIWDVYESVVSKTAKRKPGGPLGSPRTAKSETMLPGVKTEPGDTQAGPSHPDVSGLADMQEVKLEPPDRPVRQPSVSPRKAKKEQASFDWTKPRVMRLPLPPTQPGEPPEHTYFWVVPSTSGLERTPMAEQVQNFAHLRAFSESLRAGQAGSGADIAFLDIDLDGVRQTSEAIASAASARAGRAAG